MKALPANQQQEKRELDTEAVKELDGEVDDKDKLAKIEKTDKSEKQENDDNTKEKQKTDKDNDKGK